MRRRGFITLIGGAAAAGALPFVAQAQQADRMRHIAILGNSSDADTDTVQRLAGLYRGLNALGWVEGKNLKIDRRWSAGDPERVKAHAQDLARSAVELIVVYGTPATAALKQATSNIPIVFALLTDPVGEGFVDSLSRPGGNITGFSAFDSEMSGKWMALLKEVAPGVARAALLFNPRTSPGFGGPLMQQHFRTTARQLAVEPMPMPIDSAADMERTLADHASRSGGGLVAMPDGFLFVHSALLVRLANELRLPAIYPFRHFATIGGLMSYGVNTVDLSVRAASYVDRILKGEKPADLPVQAPNTFGLAINLKSAKALGLDVPPTLLATADEVFE